MAMGDDMKTQMTPPLWLEVNGERWMRMVEDGKQCTGTWFKLIVNGWGYVRWM